MRRTTTAAALLLLLATVGIAFADDDCNIPVADWQPRDVLRQKVEQQQPGWEIKRIKVDDGCYEVKAIDRDGNKIEAKYVPDSLRLRKLETTYRDDSSRSGARDSDGKDDRE